jgi:hypothetical protein
LLRQARQLSRMLSSSSLHAVGLVAPDRELCRQTNMRPRSSGLEGMTVM